MLQVQIEKDLLEARKAKDEKRKSPLTMLKSAIDNEAIKLQHDLSEAEVLVVVKRQIKEVSASIDGAKLAKRDDLLSEYQSQMAILSTYLPQMKTKHEIIKLLVDNGAAKGMSMKELMMLVKQLNDGTIDNKIANEVVREKFM